MARLLNIAKYDDSLYMIIVTIKIYNFFKRFVYSRKDCLPNFTINPLIIELSQL